MPSILKLASPGIKIVALQSVSGSFPNGLDSQDPSFISAVES